MPASKRGQRHLGEQGDGDLYVARAAGSYLFDTRGKRYIDFVMGWCVGNFGWGDPELERRIERFSGPDYVYPDYSYRPWEELATLLARIAPGDLTSAFARPGARRRWSSRSRRRCCTRSGTHSCRSRRVITGTRSAR